MVSIVRVRPARCAYPCSVYSSWHLNKSILQNSGSCGITAFYSEFCSFPQNTPAQFITKATETQRVQAIIFLGIWFINNGEIESWSDFHWQRRSHSSAGAPAFTGSMLIDSMQRIWRVHIHLTTSDCHTIRAIVLGEALAWELQNLHDWYLLAYGPCLAVSPSIRQVSKTSRKIPQVKRWC